jgi:hypothetical protein
MNFLLVLMTLTATLLTTGCGNFSAINMNKSLPKDSPNVLSMDSKQRGILSNVVEEKSAGATTGMTTFVTRTRICAEPPPDVFTAIALSLAAEAEAGKTPAHVNANGKLAAGLSENASTIERTQTVNVLREMMYRNCERYMNGAMNADAFTVQAARDHRLILDLLAIEQLTGVARAQATALTTNSKALGGSSAAMTALEAARINMITKQAEVAKALEELKDPAKAANQTASLDACKAALVIPTEDPEKIKKETFNASCKKLIDANSGATAALSHYEVMQGLAKTATNQGATSTGVAATFSKDDGALQVDTDLRKTVLEIVKLNSGFDELQMMCISVISNHDRSATGDSSDTASKCLEMIKAKQQIRIAEDQAMVEAYENKKWGVLFSSDTSLSAAKDEVKNAQKLDKLLIPPDFIKVYKRRNYFATVILASSRTNAQSIKETIDGKHPKRGALIVDIDQWCTMQKLDTQDSKGSEKVIACLGEQ